MAEKLLHLSNPRQNQLIAELPHAEWRRWQPQLELVDLSRAQVLVDSGSATAYAYFPTTAIVSLLCVMRTGEATEVAVVGHDGMVGLSLLMGDSVMTSKAVVQSAGQAYRMRAHLVTDALDRSAAVMQILLRYTESIIGQVAQTAVCNRYHSVDQQLCRRLLLGLDRLGSNILVMTQEVIATLLGVRRESVTAAALKLQEDGVISYHRGQIAVLDRGRLEQRTCECYAASLNPRHARPQAVAAGASA